MKHSWRQARPYRKVQVLNRKVQVLIIATAKLFRVRLLFRRGIGKRGEGHTGSFNCE
jgi:hypothetical protein